MSKTARSLVCGLPVLLVALLLTVLLPDSVKFQLAPFVRNITTGLFLTAGVLRMATWRLRPDWSTARSAMALLVIGTALPATPALDLMVHGGPVLKLEAPETRLLIVGPLVVIALLAARHSPRQLRRTVLVLTTVSGVVFAACLALGGNPPPDESHELFWLAVEAVTAAAWTTFALQTWERRRLTGSSAFGWLIVALCLMAGTELCKAWSLAAAGAIHALGGCLQLGAAIVALALSGAGLWTTIRSEADDSGTLARTLVDTQQRLDRVENSQRQRLHDARSAVLGVVGASQLLAKRAPLSSVDPDDLRAMVTRELDRLTTLLQLDDEPRGEFDLAEALTGVVRARRLDGVGIDVECCRVRANGRARATATVIDNLLRNADRHAPGARIHIGARTVGDQVEIVVSDDGPGIPVAERASVLLAGVRGTQARGEGEGCGLYSAASAMAAQDGTLEIGTSVWGGAEIVLRMPAASDRHALVS